MAVNINADTVVGGAVVTADASGVLALQAAGNTALTINSSRAIGVGASGSFGSSGQVLISGGSGAAPSWGAVAVPSGTTLTNPTITDYTETRFTANSSTAITLNLANGTMQDITLTGSATITMPTATAGKSFLLLLRSGAGSYTVTWTTVKWPGGTAPTITSTASRMDIYSFYSDGTNWYGTTVGQNYTP